MDRITFKVVKILILVLFSVGMKSSGFAQDIFSNSITGINPSDDNPYIDGQIVDAQITVSGIGRGPGISGIGTNDRYDANNWNLLSIDLDDYFEFTLTPNDCNEINLISFEYAATSTFLLGPASFSFRSSVDGFSSDIGSPNATGTTIDLSGAPFQNITGPITFRLYAWGGLNLLNGHFGIDDFSFKGSVSPIVTTWSSGIWDNGVPTGSINAIIGDDYNTSVGGLETSFSTCSLTINTGATLTIADDGYVEVTNGVVIDGDLRIQPTGSLVQHNNNAAVVGTAVISKETAPMNDWYEYTYWSSPVSNETVGSALSDSDVYRRFIFDAGTYSDSNGDGIDDDANDWTWVSGTAPMAPGVGYAATHSPILFDQSLCAGGPDCQFVYDFTGIPNNGVIEVPVQRNDAVTTDFNWNFIGNPYPSAIDVDLFFDANIYDAVTNPTGNLEGAIYLWSQNAAPSAANDGNEQLNFSMSDYAIINRTGANAPGGDGDTPNRYIPSGQGFFIAYSDSAPASSGNAVFNNGMRVAGNNDQFFRVSNSNQPNKVKVDLTTDNGVFSQILVGYVDGATDAYDGMVYDAPRNLSSGQAATLYTTIENNPYKFAIQGKNPESLDADEIIYLGFKNTIADFTPFTLGLAQPEGEFMTNTPIYLVDNMLQETHDLTQSDYTFTSEVGEFNDRFELRFASTLSGSEDRIVDNRLILMKVSNNKLSLSTSRQSRIVHVNVYDFLGRQLQNIDAKNQTEINFDFRFSDNLACIIEVQLSGGQTIRKVFLCG